MAPAPRPTRWSATATLDRAQPRAWRRRAALLAGYVAWRGPVPFDALGVAASRARAHRSAPGPAAVRALPGAPRTLLNFVAFARQAGGRRKAGPVGRIADVRAALADFHDEVRRSLAAVPDGRCHQWGLFARSRCRAGSRVASRCSAMPHPMPPLVRPGAASVDRDAVAAWPRRAPRRRWSRHSIATNSPAMRARDPVHRESAVGGERLAGLHPEKPSNATMQNEDTLGLFGYDPATAPLVIERGALSRCP